MRIRVYWGDEIVIDRPCTIRRRGLYVCSLYTGYLMTRIVFHEDEELRVTVNLAAVANHQVAFVFSYHRQTNEPLPDTGYAESWLTRNAFDVVAFMSKQNNWFQSISTVLLDELNTYLHQTAPQHQLRVAMGASMGGYGAMQFAKLLGCTRVLAFSPQYSIADNFDSRFLAESQAITFNWAVTAEMCQRDIEYYIVYDPFHKMDRLHTAMYEAVETCTVHKYPVRGSGHLTPVYLQQIGCLNALVESVLDGRGFPNIDHRTLRKQSVLYLNNMAKAMLKRQKPGIAASILDAAVLAYPDAAELRSLQSRARDEQLSGGRGDAVQTATASAPGIDPLAQRPTRGARVRA